ncbi:MAG: ABC transporter ATP-binding protein [Paramuribaculum sp.]|nr:ABC transporter ATP-binding protein [Paramuribaculum sp.]
MIKATGIKKSFDGLEVLRGIDIDIAKGEIVSIVGPSGAGKTTLLQILGTLDRPDAGRVVIDGQDMGRLSPNRLARLRNARIGFVFQFHQLLPEFTLAENVALPAMIGGLSRSKALRQAAPIIEYLGLTARATHRPSQLSGGERQRAAVARALINNPGVVLADEPSGSLDSHNRDELHRLFFDLRRDFGHTFVIVTHDNDLATRADRMVNITDGVVSSITVPSTNIITDKYETDK